jgi:hypothetical protein
MTSRTAAIADTWCKPCSDSRAGALDVEAGVLVVVHQPPSKVDGLLLGQVACGDFGFECAP